MVRSIVLFFFLFLIAPPSAVASTAADQSCVLAAITFERLVQGMGGPSSQVERSREIGGIVRTLFEASRADLAEQILPQEKAMELEKLAASGDGEAKAKEELDAAYARLSQFRNEVQAVLGKCDPKNRVASIPVSKPSKVIDLNTLLEASFDKPILKLGMPAVDEKRRKLYVAGTRTTLLGIIDMDRMVLEKTVDIGVRGGFLLCDEAGDALYIFQIEEKQFYKLDRRNFAVTAVNGLPSHMRMPDPLARTYYKDYELYDTGFPFRAGYLQERNASYGVIHVIDKKANKEIRQILHGPDALYFAVDQVTGRLFTVNTGDASVDVYALQGDFDHIAHIRVGLSVEEMLTLDHGNTLAVRSRLGGSKLYFYDFEKESVSILDNENFAPKDGVGVWPTGMIEDSGHLYVLGHYAGRIDVYDAVTRKLERRMNLDLALKPRTDAISSMVMDHKKKIIYVAVPEAGLIQVVNGADGKLVKSIKVAEAPKEIHGPFALSLCLDESNGNLFVYMPHNEMLLRLASGTYEVSKRVKVKVPPHHLMLYADGYLYLGNKAFEAREMKEAGDLGGEVNAIAYNPAQKALYIQKTILSPTTRQKSDLMQEVVDGRVTRQWGFKPTPSIPVNYRFDFERGRFFVGYFELGKIEMFSLGAQ